MIVMRYGMFFILMFQMVVLTGCENHSLIGGGSVNMLQSTEKKEIIFWHTFSEKETYVFENYIIPSFEKEFPTIEVKPVRQGHNEELKSALISRASANKPPDIVRMDIAWIPHFAQLGLLYPVSDFDKFYEVTQSLYKKPLETNFYDGKYYGVPLNTNTKVSIYNKEQLQEIGEVPETMDELIGVVKSHHLVLGIKELTVWETLQYFYGLGGKLTNSSYTKAQGYLDSEESIEAITQLLDLYKNGNITPKILEGSTNTWEGILDGTYFMIDEGPWFYSVRPSEEIKFVNEQTVSAPFPITNGKRAILGGENLVITKGTKNPEAAWEFVKWMTKKKSQNYLASTGLIPSNKLIDLSDYFNQYPYFRPFLDGLEDALLRPPVAQWQQIEEIYEDHLKLIFSEKISVEDGLEKAAIQIDQILRKETGR